jgi:hypothetical protein
MTRAELDTESWIRGARQESLHVRLKLVQQYYCEQPHLGVIVGDQIDDAIASCVFRGGYDSYGLTGWLCGFSLIAFAGEPKPDVFLRKGDHTVGGPITLEKLLTNITKALRVNKCSKMRLAQDG